MKLSLPMLVAVCSFSLLSGAVSAASREVCFRLQLADGRYNCAADSETGVRRGCNNGGYVDAVGHQVELWNKDANSDDYIGTWYISGGGTQCIVFEWENAAYSKGKPNPNLYLRYINMVNASGFRNYIYVKAVTTDGGAHNVTSWRDGPAGDENRYVAAECRAGVTCYMFPSGSLVPTNDRASPRALRIMALDSAQHTLQAMGEIMNRHVKLHYPGRPACTTSCTDDRENFHIRDSQGGDGILTGHELGHVLQLQQFNNDNLHDDVSKGGDGWDLISDEYDSGATQEGFASYIGLLSWYDPNNFGAVPRGWGLNFEAAAPNRATCSANRGIPLQVAKAFWDIDDWNNEAGTGVAAAWPDSLRYGSEDIVIGWRQFSPGTGNRQQNESGRDGVNIKDFYENNKGRLTAVGFYDTFIRHNCLQDQLN